MSLLKSDPQLAELGLSETDAFDYLLLDGVKMEPVLKWVYQHIDNPEWYPLYKDTRYQDVIDLSPCLVKVPIDSDIPYLFESDLGPKGSAIWLRSPYELELLGSTLSRLLWITTEDGRYLHYRFYDPTSLSRFVPALTPDESAELYPGIECITWFNAQQQTWQKLTLPETKAPLPQSSGVIFKPQWLDVILTANE